MIFAKRSVQLSGGKSLYIVPFGDIQTDAEYDRLRDLVKWLQQRESEGHQVLMFGMGDYFESPSPSDRAAIRAAKRGFGLYEELAKDIENVYANRAIKISELLESMKGRIAGLLQGHHFLEFVSSGMPKDTTRYLAELLGAEFWGDTVVLTLTINGKEFTIVATHGYGSARTPGARVIKRLRMREVYLTADWYVMGHDNEKSVYVTEALVKRNYKKQYYTGSGSFQRAYNFDDPEGTYAEKLMLPPSALGVVICTVKIQEGRNGQQRLDYHIST